MRWCSGTLQDMGRAPPWRNKIPDDFKSDCACAEAAGTRTGYTVMEDAGEIAVCEMGRLVPVGTMWIISSRDRGEDGNVAN